MRPIHSLACLALLWPSLSGCLGGSVSLEGRSLLDTAPRPLVPEGPLPDLAGERLRYQVTFAGVPAGSLVTWGATMEDRPRWFLDGSTTGLLDLLHPVRAKASTWLGTDGLPQAFQVWCEEDGRSRARRVQFGAPTTLWWQEGDRIAPRAVPLETTAALDPLSFLWLLRSEPPEGTWDLEVLAGPRADRYRVRSLGRADVEVAAGRYPDSLAYEVEIRTLDEAGDAAAPRIAFELYLDGAAPHVPVLLRRPLSLGCLAVELSATEAGAAAPPAAPTE